MKYQANKKGETLIEVIAALTSLVLAGIAAMTLIISVMTSTAISKEYLIAQNLAREGIEGVTNIRDTNWLLFPSDKDKWLDLDGVTGGDKMTAEKFYKLGPADAGAFKLTDGEFGDIKNETYRLWVNNKNLYLHSQEGKIDPQPFPTFYRQITFDNMTDPDTIKVTVKVYWESKSKPTTYELNSILANYEK